MSLVLKQSEKVKKYRLFALRTLIKFMNGSIQSFYNKLQINF